MGNTEIHRSTFAGLFVPPKAFSSAEEEKKSDKMYKFSACPEKPFLLKHFFQYCHTPSLSTCSNKVLRRRKKWTEGGGASEIRGHVP